MKLIEALQKWNKVTNDGGKTVYSTTSAGHVVSCTDELGGVINPTIKLLTSTGWEKYREPLILPERVCVSGTYFRLDSLLGVYATLEGFSSVDMQRFSSYNYYPDKALAQYIADKNLIQRVKLVLEHLNKDNPDKEVLINKYIRDNYKDVIDRIKEYEVVQFIGGRHNV